MRISCPDRALGTGHEIDIKLAVLSVTGGVPKYLEEIDPGLSAEENIRHLCFRPGGILFREFEQIFSDVFDKRATGYRDIVKTLVRGRRNTVCATTTRASI